MKHLETNVTFISNDKALSSEEKLKAIQNECQQSLYSEEEYDNARYWKTISKETFMNVFEPEENEYTNIPTEYMEAWIDWGLREFVRLVHANAQCDVTQEELDNFDKLDDVASFEVVSKNNKHFAKLWETCEWDKLIVTEMYAGKILPNNKIRKEATCPFSYLSNFFEVPVNTETCTNDDVINAVEVWEKIKKIKKQERQMKMIWKQIREDRIRYKKFYDLSDKYKTINPERSAELKKKWDAYYKDYLKFSKAMDEIKALDDKAIKQKKQDEVDYIRSLFVAFQQAAPSYIIEKLPKEDIQNYYKSFWYNATVKYLRRAIKRAEELSLEDAKLCA